MCSREIQQKSKETLCKNHGYDSPLRIPEVLKKFIKTNQEIYGGNSPMCSIEIQQKSKETCADIWGYDNWAKHPDSKTLLRENGLLYWHRYNSESQEIIFFINKVKLLDEEYMNAHYYHNWGCIVCNKGFNTKWNNIQQGYKCPYCFPRNSGVSMQEKEVLEFIQSILPSDIEIHENTRKIIPPQELDIYIPSLNLAIEYNGDYWHSEEKLGKDYHENKTLKCKELDIDLVHISENDWVNENKTIRFLLSTIIDEKSLEIKI